MKYLSYCAIAIMAVCLAACGGKKNSESTDEEEVKKEPIVLNPETTKIKGDLGDYFEVVEKEYTTDGIVSVEVKRTDVAFSFNLDGVEPYGYSGQSVKGNAGFGIEVLDENGNVIEKAAATTGGLGGMYSHDDMKEALKLKAGETATVRWSLSLRSDQKPVKFRLTSAYEAKDNSSSSSSSSSSYSDDDDDDNDSYSSSSSSSSGSQDWDALLNSYEQYVNKYISYMKKASNGDMSAMADAPALMSKAQDVASKMEGAKGEMSASQWARYTRILAKLNKAAMEMR